MKDAFMEVRNRDAIRVGMTASLTGRYGGQGRQALVGVQAWVDDVNRAGGIRLGDRAGQLPVRFVYYDDASDPEQCAAVTERLITADHVEILLGPYSSGLARRAAAVAHRYQRVLWNHGGASQAIYEAGFAWVVGLLTPASQYFHGVIDLMRQAYATVRRVAIVSSTAGVFPREVAAGAEQYCRTQGFDTVLTYTYRPGTADFSNLLRQLHTGQPQGILGVGRIEDDIRFAAQLVHSNIAVEVAGLIATPLALFRNVLGRAAEGFLGPSQWEPGIIAVPEYGPTSPEVMRSLLQRSAAGVDYPMAQAYAGCLVAQRCIEEAGSLEQHALRHIAGQLDFTTFYGRYCIDPATGCQLGHRMPVVQWQGGEKVVVWPPEMSLHR
jgi:branched-chain amino acid transport system substrate-binding protein